MNKLELAGLSEPALAALAAIGQLGETDRAEVLQLHKIALGPRLWRAQDGDALPRLTQLVPVRDRDAIYRSSAWAAYRPERWIACYFLQSPGLASLSAGLGGICVAKGGTAAVESVERRAIDLGVQGCGAWHRGSEGYQRAPGFDVFFPPSRLQLAAQHERSPVRLGRFGPEVGLPATLSKGRFEVEYNVCLSPLRLQNVAATGVGRAICARAGIDPAQLVRYYRAEGKYRAATELALLRPQADCNSLAKLCADIVIDHIFGLLPRRSGR